MTEAKIMLASGMQLMIEGNVPPQPALPLLESVPWTRVAEPLANAEDAVARLDERLRTSPIADGVLARAHFADAAAALWLEAELVDPDELVLHDAGMDVRTPTHEITRAHAVLRARRTIFREGSGWALSTRGLDFLRGRGRSPALEKKPAPDNSVVEGLLDGELVAALATLDSAESRALQRVTAPVVPDERRNPLVYDEDFDDDAKLAEWRDAVAQTESLPPVLAAAAALAAWIEIAPLQRADWLGPLLAASLLRCRGKTRTHLACLSLGLKSVDRKQRRAADPAARLVAVLDAFAAAARAGLKEHDRLLLAKGILERKLLGRRSTSKLPGLIEYAIETPVASAGMIAQRLNVTPRGAQDLVAELGLREATGRGRYRAWGL